MDKLWKLLKTLDDNLLIIALSFFAFLVPLYPKLPLFNVEYTYIAIRADDFFITILAALFFVQWLRRKVVLNRKFLLPVLIFWGAVFTSFYWNNYVSHLMPYHQVSFLHALRRVEYMLVFFIAASAIKKKSDFLLLLYSSLISLSMVVAYAFAQKFLGFPAVQTMNPAFSKGIILFLTPEARISSTFSGHYDLAAYLVLMIPIVWSLFFAQTFTTLKKTSAHLILVVAALAATFIAYNMRVTSEWIIISGLLAPVITFWFFKFKKQESKIIFIVIVGAIYALIFTASRISFIAYLVSTPLLLFFLKKYKYLVFVIIITAAMFFTSRDLANRFSKTFQVKQILVNEKTGQVFIPQIITSKELPAGSAYINLRNNQGETDATTKYKTRIIDETIANKTLSKQEKDRIIASLSADIQPVSGFVADISFATRLQVEWPRAINALLKNPVLGTGPFSITEATDNDYLRWLGEFGLAGFLSFIYLLGSVVWFIYSKTGKMAASARPVFYGIIFGLGAVMVNAGYIDVFEASKVAYMIWYLLGIYIGVLSLKQIATD